MAIRKRSLGEGEQVIFHMRTHGKALVGPGVAMVLLGAALGAGIALLPASAEPWGPWALVAVFLLLVLVLVLVPFLKWLTTTYSVTNRRIITRRGILNRTGHDLPLRRINNVNYHRSLIDRMLGCGTLVLETAAGHPLALRDLPRVEQVHQEINDLLFHDDDRRIDNGWSEDDDW